jgi:hypothetical protein
MLEIRLLLRSERQKPPPTLEMIQIELQEPPPSLEMLILLEIEVP